MKDIIIVGTGKASFLHYYSYKKFEKIGRVYFVDIDGKIKNENIKDSKVYSSIESTIKEEKLDVNNIIVDICTPKSVFLDIVMECKQLKIRDIMKNPTNREYIEEMYSTMESELNSKLQTLKSQIELEEKNNNNKQNIVQVKKDTLKIFDDILEKEKLDKQDLETIIDCIYIYEDKIIIKLKSNIENILDIGNNIGISRQNITAIQKNQNHNDRKFFTQVKRGELCSNVINNGDPLEIFTDKEGEVILKKYSPIGELSEFATEYAETLNKTTGHIACITDKDTVIAISGASKKEWLEKEVSNELERIMEDKEQYISKENNDLSVPITQNENKDRIYNSQVIYPIISDGNTIGSVILLSKDSKIKMSEVEQKVAQSAANFLGKQMEI